MKVCVFPSDIGAGCSYYRVFEPVEAAKRLGVEASWSIDLPLEIKRLSNGLDKITGFKSDFDADVVVFHRPLDYRFIEAARFFKKAGIGVVVDMDDDIIATNPNADFARIHDISSNALDNHRHCQQACKAAHVVTCSTPTVERRWGFGHGVVARNGIPPHALEMEHVGGAGIGWAGSTGSRYGDLEVVGDGVQRALEETGLPFLFVGAHSQAQEVRNGLRLKIWPKITGWAKPGEHYANVAKLDIGIAPVSGTPFAQARSGIKVLEYAAFGIPSVVSPHPEYELLKDLCRVATTPEEWRSQLVAVASSREEDCSSMRKQVADLHTTDCTITAYIDAWETAQKKAQR